MCNRICCVDILPLQAPQQFRPFVCPPEMSEANRWFFLPNLLADDDTNRRTYSNTFAVVVRGKDRRIRLAVGCQLAGFPAIAVQTVQPQFVELAEKPLPHHHK